MNTLADWPQAFKDNAPWIRVHPSAVLGPGATIKIFNWPDPPRVMLDIGPECHIFSTFSLLHPEAQISIGPRCQLGASNIIARRSVRFDGDTLMAWNVTLIDTDAHSPYWDERKDDVRKCLAAWMETKGWDIGRHHHWPDAADAPIHVGAKTWIGFGASILKGVTIGEGAIIGAGSVVTRDMPAWHMAAGNPCRPIKPLPASRGGAS